MHVSASREGDNVLLFALSNHDEEAEVLVSSRATRYPFVVEQQGWRSMCGLIDVGMNHMRGAFRPFGWPKCIAKAIHSHLNTVRDN